MSDIDQTHLIFTLESDQNTLVANFGPYLPLQLNSTATSILVAAGEAQQAVIDAQAAATQSAQYTAAAQSNASSATTSANQSLVYSNIAKSQSDSATTSAAQAAQSATDAANTAGSITNALSKFAPVATSGSYLDLTNKPTIPPAQVNSDWNATAGIAQVLNKPTLSLVALSGSYNDLSNKPTIPPAYNLPAASTSVLGGVKVGGNLSIDVNGVLSAAIGVKSFNARSGDITLTADDLTSVGGVLYDTSGSTNTLKLAVPSIFNGTATYNNASTFNGPVTYNNVSTFDGEAVFDNATTYNSTVTFNSAITFSNQITVNGTSTFNNTTTVNGPITFGSSSTFNTAPTFNDPIKVTSGGTGVNVMGLPGQILVVNSTASGLVWATPSSYALPQATASTLGGVKIGDGLAIASDGTLVAPTQMIVQGGHGITTSSSGITTSLTVQEAQLDLGLMNGLVAIGNGGTGLTALGTSGQVLSSNGSGMQWIDTPTVTPYTLPAASADVLGGIKVGSGLSINGSGVLSATGGSATDLPDQSGKGGYYLSTDGTTLHWSHVSSGGSSSGYTRVENVTADKVLDSTYANALIILQSGVTSITLPPSGSMPIGSTISILSLTNTNVSILTTSSDPSGVFPSISSAFDFNVFTPITATRGTTTMTLWEGVSYSNAFSPYWNQVGTSTLNLGMSGSGGSVYGINMLVFSDGTALSSGNLDVGSGGTGLTQLGAAGQVLSVNTDASALEYASLPYDLTTYIRGKPVASEIVYSFLCPRSFAWPELLTGSFATATVAATASSTFAVTRNDAPIGSFTFPASGSTATFTFSSAVTFNSGDVIQIVAPATPDPTLANIAVTFAGKL